MIPPQFTTFAARIGISGAVIAVLGASLAVQTVRIEGFKVWPIEHTGYKAENSDLKADLAKIRTAQAEASQRALTERLRQQTRYRLLSEQADHEIEQIQERADLALRDYAIRNRVFPQAPRGASGGTVAASGDSDSGVPAELPADAIVGVSFADLQICTDNSLIALEAFNWAQGLNEAP